MAELVSINSMQNLMDWSWEKAVEGIPGSTSAIELADSYLRSNQTVEEAIDSLIRWQCIKCGTSGFITGLGGLITLPVAVPANLASTLYIQMRMIAAVAYMCNLDIKNDQVQTLGYACLCGASAGNLIKEAGINVGEKILISQIKHIPREVLIQINRKVGILLITKFGETGIINLSKIVPILGGVIGGGIDATITRAIGIAAKNLFYQNDTLKTELIETTL